MKFDLLVYVYYLLYKNGSTEKCPHEPVKELIIHEN